MMQDPLRVVIWHKHKANVVLFFFADKDEQNYGKELKNFFQASDDVMQIFCFC